MCIPLTPVLTLLYIVIIEVYLQCFTESIRLRDIGKPTSRAEKSSPSSLYLKAVKGVHLGSALIVSSKMQKKETIHDFCMSTGKPYGSHITFYGNWESYMSFYVWLELFLLANVGHLCTLFIANKNACSALCVPEIFDTFQNQQQTNCRQLRALRKLHNEVDLKGSRGQLQNESENIQSPFVPFRSCDLKCCGVVSRARIWLHYSWGFCSEYGLGKKCPFFYCCVS